MNRWRQLAEYALTHPGVDAVREYGCALGIAETDERLRQVLQGEAAYARKRERDATFQWSEALRGLLREGTFWPPSSTPGDWTLLLMELDEDTENSPQPLLEQARKLRGMKAFAIHDARMLLLLDAPARADIDTLVSEGALIAACSNTFPDVAEMGKHYRLVRQLLRVGKYLHGEGRLYRAEDFGATLYFLNIAGDIPLSMFHAGEVLQVMEHDLQNDTSLSKSLYTYLSTFQNTKVAAEEMFMHRNTMEYQIRKIQSIIGNDLQDENTVFDMMCTYVMLVVEGVL